MARRFLPVVAVVLLTLACSAPVTRDGLQGIVFISIDTLRADHLGAYGYSRDTSPFLDRMAAGGVLFEQAHAPSPWTLPSHATMMTGLYPSTHRAVDGNEGIATAVPMAAELFRDAGFATGGFVSSFFVSRRYGFERGFDAFEDFEQTLRDNHKNKIDGARVIDEASRWLRGNGRQPFFLFVHLYDVHYDYNPPPEHRLFDTGYRGPRPRYKKYSHYVDNPLPEDLLEYEVSQYDGEIHYVDSLIERLHGVLTDLGADASTLMLVTADHGEEFFERGSWGHAHTLYEEQVRVPLIIKGHGVAPGRRIDAPVRHVDLLPTLLEAAGIDDSVDASFQGRSFWPVLSDPQADDGPPRPAFFETSRFGSNKIGIFSDGWKLIHDLASGERQLYEVQADAGETRDRIADAEERRASMERELEAAGAAFVPDRWLVRWYADGEAPLEGELYTDGHFLLAGLRSGEGRVRREGEKVLFELQPQGEVQAVVVPVDAKVMVRRPPRAGGAEVPLVLGKSTRTAWAKGVGPSPGEPLTVSSHENGLMGGSPTPLPPAAAFWLEQSRGGGGTVHLSREERERLESLGYVMPADPAP